MPPLKNHRGAAASAPLTQIQHFNLFFNAEHTWIGPREKSDQDLLLSGEQAYIVVLYIDYITLFKPVHHLRHSIPHIVR